MPGSATAHLHPITADWFSRQFGAPTDPQARGWPEIARGRNVLIAAPTGSGKTLAAFLTCIDRLLRDGLDGRLTDATQVLYVSPLKALSNDVRKNLEVPLAGVVAAAEQAGHVVPPIRVAVRTGDTPASERARMARRPPHILVTTPESLYILLTSESGRRMMRTVRTVIVDEIHALARDKRGTHLALSLERLETLTAAPPVRIGLSATVRPVDAVARFLVGSRRVDAEGRPDCRVLDVGHMRDLDLAVEVPPSELSAVCSNEQWAEVYQGLAERIRAHRSTLVFVNTRRMAERVSHHLRELLGEDAVASHHGSLSRTIRLSAEEKLKNGELKAIVATASLELGIDIGFIDLVCQLGSPRSIATFLQRVGRSGHSLGATPRGRLFPLTRDELVETLALVRAVRAGRLDAIEIPVGSLDILAQQIVATVAGGPAADVSGGESHEPGGWDEDALFELVRGAWPYRNLGREDFDSVLDLLSEGIGGTRSRGAHLHQDRVGKRLRARRGARIAASTSGGAIPEMADYRVVTEGERTYVGTVNEDFAIESLAGDIFLLGNTSWRVAYVRAGEVVVNDAHGAPATVPFWLGEAPGRTVELSQEVSRLRSDLASFVSAPPGGRTREEVLAVLARECGASDFAAQQVVTYVEAEVAAIGLVPTQEEVVFERFFDEAGGMQLVIHAPFGSRINRAWGLALRKRFCRSFDFELQASADDNGILLSLSPQHSFPIEHMFKLLPSGQAHGLLVQALLAAPMFQTRWRWNLTRALTVLRQQGGKKVPPPLQRFRSDDLLAAVFPGQVACQENRPGDIEVPDHPLVKQTVYDCLHEAMDLERWLDVLRRMESGQIKLVARDTREPSPFSYQILNAYPYAFLDDAPLEERRARAVATRRTLSVDDVRDLARLDPEAIERVRADAWPMVRDADELHDALLALYALPESEAAPWQRWLDELSSAGRATRLVRDDGPSLWVSAERWPLVAAAYPRARMQPVITPPAWRKGVPGAAEAWVALMRGQLEARGPVTSASLMESLGLTREPVESALLALEGEGFALRGQFTPRPGDAAGTRRPFEQLEWCERRLLARIHRLTMEGLRKQIQPVEPAHFLQFLMEHQHIVGAAVTSVPAQPDAPPPPDAGPGAPPSEAPPSEARTGASPLVSSRTGREGLLDVIEQLQGFEMPAGAWEHDVLPARLAEYDQRWLDDLSMSGTVAWGRLQPPRREANELDELALPDPDASDRGIAPNPRSAERRVQPSSSPLTRVVPIALVLREDLPWLLPPDRRPVEGLARANAQRVLEVLAARGALFPTELAAHAHLLPAQLDDALGELAALGAITSDGFSSVRGLVSPERKRVEDARRRLLRRPVRAMRPLSRGGRWSLFPGAGASGPGVAEVPDDERHENWAWQLLARYGVIFRDLLARESVAPPWRSLLPIYRKLEARGEIRGGRFVAGVAGEQFATSETVDRLRRMRDAGLDDSRTIVLSAAEPANLSGIITPGPRVPAIRTNRLLVRAGRVVASLQGAKVVLHEPLPAAQAERDGDMLKRRIAH